MTTDYTDEDLENIANDAVDFYGPDIQMIVLIEELSELIKALTKFIRYGDAALDSVYEEYADVLLAMKSLEVVLVDIDDDPASRLEEQIVRKMKRLANRLAEDKLNDKNFMDVTHD